MNVSIYRIGKFIENNIPKDKSYVIGISGGIDSAFVYKILQSSKRNIIPVYINIESSDDSLLRAKELCGNKLIICDYTDTYKIMKYEFFKNNENISDEKIIRLTKANLKSRLRMNVLYMYANLYNGVVIGTTNKTEYFTGYFTKYGDGGVDIEPIIHIYKTDIYKYVEKFNHNLNIPESIIKASPSADLFEGQTDEDEMNITYKMLDLYLKIRLDREDYFGDDTDLIDLFGENVFNIVENLLNSARHKHKILKYEEGE